MREGWLGLRAAVGLLTILPVTSSKFSSRDVPRSGTPSRGIHRLSPEEMARAMVWFPPVGAGIGAFAALIWLWASGLWPEPIPAALGLTTWVAVTGALHLDGFADTVDGLAAWKGPQETLRIMQDSRIGAIGAVGLILLLLLKWAFLLALPSYRILGALVAVGALSRLCLVLCAQFFPYVPGKEGLGRLVTDHRSTRIWASASVVGIVLALASVGPARGCLCLGVAGICLWGVNRVCISRLGGITGDTLGALNEVLEVVLLGALAAFRG